MKCWAGFTLNLWTSSWYLLFPRGHTVLSLKLLLPYSSPPSQLIIYILIEVIRRELPKNFQCHIASAFSIRGPYSAFLPVPSFMASSPLPLFSSCLLKDLILAVPQAPSSSTVFSFYIRPQTSYYFSHLKKLSWPYFIRPCPISSFPFVENTWKYCQCLLFPALLLLFSLKPASARLLPTTTPWELGRQGHQWLPPCSISWSVFLLSLWAARGTEDDLHHDTLSSLHF